MRSDNYLIRSQIIIKNSFISFYKNFDLKFRYKDILIITWKENNKIKVAARI